MYRSLRQHLTYANVVSTACLFILLGGIGYAATGFVSSSGTIHGCIGSGGQLTVIKPGKRCRAHTTPISWNQEGPAGSNGAAGVVGATGPAGATGAAGLAGTPGENGATKVVVRTLQVQGTGQFDGDASCAEGERATGGGFYAGGNGGFITVLNSYPVPLESGKTPTGWHVDVINPENINAPMSGEIAVVCAAP